MDFKKIKEQAIKIGKKYYKKEDLVHGYAHIERVYYIFNEYINKESTKEKKNDINVLQCLKIAIILHDIGKNLEELIDGKKHGEIAIDILKEDGDGQELIEMLGEENWEIVKHTIKGHSKSSMIKDIKNPPKDDKDICLSLLLVLDNMDAIGEIGFYRDLQDFMNRGPSKNFLLELSFVRDAFLKERLLKNRGRIADNVTRLKNIKNEKEKLRKGTTNLVNHYEELQSQYSNKSLICEKTILEEYIKEDERKKKLEKNKGLLF